MMQTANPNVMEWITISAHRSGSNEVNNDYLRFKRLLRGREGAAGNFELTFCQAVGSPPIPRHRHNFEQFRIQLSGTYCFKPDMPMVEGDLAYFPEGAYYGPENAVDDPVMVVLQFGGPSGQGFMSMDQVTAGARKLSEKGVFAGGVYRPANPQEAEKDGYEAVWEEVMKTPLQYPEPRYPDPILIHSNNFTWREVGQHIFVRPLGVFSEARTQVDVVRLTPGAHWSLVGDDRVVLMFFLSGAAEVAGYKAEQHHAVALDPHATTTIVSKDGAEVVMFYLADPSSGASMIKAA
jgi:hypothetical protein